MRNAQVIDFLAKYRFVTFPHPNYQATDGAVILFATSIKVKPMYSVIQPQKVLEKKWRAEN